MNFEYFIAKRLIKGKEPKSSISSTIIKIAIAAIAIGMIMMLITVATGTGLQRKIREKVAAFNGHIIVNAYDTNNSEESFIPFQKSEKLLTDLQSVEGVTHMQSVAMKAGVIRTETDFEGILVKGVTDDYNWEHFEDYLIQGRIPDFTDPRNKEILISKYIANRLGFKIRDQVNTFFLKKGSSTRANIRSFEIVGIYDSGFQDFDEKFILADIRHIIKMNQWADDEVGSLELFIDDFEEIDQKGLEVYRIVPSDLEARTITMQYISIFEWLKLFDLNIIGIISIIILVAGINMITALLVLILERTPMIGILKSLGTHNWSIRKIFLINAAYLISIGLLWGNGIGILVLWLQKKFSIINLNPETYYVDTAPVYLNIGYIIALNIGTLLLCLLMLLIPSYIISKISPSKSIRFE